MTMRSSEQNFRIVDEPCEELKQANLPDAFIIDYIRVFDEVTLEEKC